MSDRESYRLTPEDETKARVRMAGTVALWRESATANYKPGAVDLDALTRVGAHSIGCKLVDLRNAEVEWLEGQARKALGMD